MQSDPVCDIHLTSIVNADTGLDESMIMEISNVTIEEKNVTIFMAPLQPNRYFIITVSSRNSAGDAASNTTISK